VQPVDGAYLRLAAAVPLHGADECCVVGAVGERANVIARTHLTLRCAAHAALDEIFGVELRRHHVGN
jgi:hypothetical protein